MKPLLLSFLGLLASLPSSLPAQMRAEEVYRDPRAEAFYRENPDFFRFAKPSDLPADLEWKDGAEQEEFADPAAKRGGTHRLFLRASPPVLRRVGPNSNNGFRGYAYDANDYNLLGSHPNTLKPIPSLATSWAMSKDGMTAYFRLDPEARFTDGQPVTADDYLFTFYFHRSPWIQAPWYADYYTREWGSITRYDDHTIAVHAPRMRPDQLLWLGGLSPTPRHFFRELGPDFVTAYAQRFQPTTGPYEIRPENFKRDASITFTRIDWWGDKRRFHRFRYNPDAIEFRIVREADKAWQMFLQGEFDLSPAGMPRYWYGLNEEPAHRLGYVSKVQFYNDIPRPPYGVYLNSLRPPLDNRDLRVGIQHSLDFQRVIDTFYRGDYGRLEQFSEGFGIFSDRSIRARAYSPALARAAFARAGYDRAGSDGILIDREGRRLSLLLTGDDSDRRKFLATLVESARRCGLELRTEALEHTPMYRKVMEKRHDMVFWAWNATGKWPELWQSHHSDNAIERTPEGRVVPKRQTNNITGTSNPELDRLIDAFRASTNEAEMLDLTHRAQRLVHEEAAFAPAFRVPGYRLAHWPWVRFPKDFDVRSSDEVYTYGLFWLEPGQREPELAAFRAGTRKGEPRSEVHDRWRAD
jgi:microcin C transport system substrate-binding protein